MNVQLRILLMVSAVVVPTIVGLVAWTYGNDRDTVLSHTYRHLAFTLEETVRSELQWRVGLLERSRMSGVEFFVVAYQKESLEALQRLTDQREGHYAVVDEQQRVLLAPWSGFAQKSIQSGHSSGAGALEHDGVRYLYARQHFAPWGWQVLYLQNDAAVAESINGILYRAILSIAISVALTMLGVLWLSRRLFVGRVLALKDAAQKIAERRSPPDIAIADGDELGDLARSMEKTARELDRHHRTSAALRQELEEANRALTEINQNLESSVEKRTVQLDAINRQLAEDLDRLNERLIDEEAKRRELVSQMSKITLNKADLAQLNARITSQLTDARDENLFLREQIESYQRLLERTNREISAIHH